METLAGKVSEDTQLRRRLRDLPQLDESRLWTVQATAITNLEASFALGKQRALVQMATGSGKTFTAVNVAYRLLKHADAKRILFLVDRGNLVKQAWDEFSNFEPPDDARKFPALNTVQRLETNAINPASEYMRISRRLTVSPGDVLLTCSGSVGRSSVVPEGLTFALVRSVAVLKPLIVSGRFMSLVMLSPALQAQIHAKKTQTAQSNIFQGQIRTLSIPLPPLDEQEAIVDIVEDQLSVIDPTAKCESAQSWTSGLRRPARYNADKTRPASGTLLEKILRLSPDRAAEVEDFVDFLAARDSEREVTHAAEHLSEASFRAVWDNADDSEYDRL